MGRNKHDRNLASRTATFVLAGGRGERLGPLTRDLAKPAVPFAGCHRIIDFTLSNCVNSGLRPVYVLTQHLRESVAGCIDASWKTWFHCLPPGAGRCYEGTADAVRQNLTLLEGGQIDYVLVLAADHVYKMDYCELLRAHEETGSDITVAAIRRPCRESRSFGVLGVDSGDRIIGFHEKPEEPEQLPDDPEACLVSMGVYVFNVGLLREVLLEDAARAASTHDFGRDLLPHLIHDRVVSAYPFRTGPQGSDAYWRDVGTLDAYYSAQIELLTGTAPLSFCRDNRWPIRSLTGFRTTHARRCSTDGSGAIVDSWVCPLSQVSGCVRGSVVAGDTVIAPGASVEDSILMAGVRVGCGARIHRAIIGEGVRIPPYMEIGYGAERKRTRFPVTEAGITVVPSGTAFPTEVVRCFAAAASDRDVLGRDSASRVPISNVTSGGTKGR